MTEEEGDIDGVLSEEEDEEPITAQKVSKLQQSIKNTNQIANAFTIILGTWESPKYMAEREIRAGFVATSNRHARPNAGPNISHGWKH